MRRILMVVGVSALGFVGCSDDTSTAGNVGATLSDFTIDLDKSSAPAGAVTFKVENKGPSVHEFVVFKTALAPDALPTDDNGDVAESADFAPVDEIENIEKGTKPKLVVDLGAGDYVIICNVPAHYRQGMHTAFKVT